MRFIYRPEGADEKSWEFKPTKMLNVESELIEDITGWTYQEFGERFMAGSTKAYHALLWVFLRRTTPGLKYEQVQFAVDEIDVDFDLDERKRMLDELSAIPDLSPEQSDLLDSLREEFVMEAEGAPKDGEPTSVGSGSGASPDGSTSLPETSTN